MRKYQKVTAETKLTVCPILETEGIKIRKGLKKNAIVWICQKCDHQFTLHKKVVKVCCKKCGSRHIGLARWPII